MDFSTRIVAMLIAAAIAAGAIWVLVTWTPEDVQSLLGGIPGVGEGAEGAGPGQPGTGTTAVGGQPGAGTTADEEPSTVEGPRTGRPVGAGPDAGGTSIADQYPGGVYEGDAFTFTRIRDDVFHASGTGNLTVGANAAVIVNESDVLLVDSHISPAAAGALLDELRRRITPLPVRWVVNTHFHFDHAHGNQVYPEDVEIIGHEFTRRMLESGESINGRSAHNFLGTLPERIETLRGRVESEQDPTERTRLEGQLAILERYKAATDAVTPTPPSITLSERLTIFRGGREIRLLFFGRGHTGGDVVVHVPAEGVLVTGDLLTGGIPYAGDGYLNEWADTLQQLETLEFDVVLPGHGEPFTDRRKIDHLQLYLRDLWAKAAEMHRAGVSHEEAARRIDMTNHADNYPNLREPGVDPLAVQRVYDLLDARR